MDKTIDLVMIELIEFIDLAETLERLPKIDINDRGKMYETECACGGTLRAYRVEYNGHMRVECKRCGFRMMQ